MIVTFFGLKQNLTKSETVDIGVLKGVQVAVCGMCSIDLNEGKNCIRLTDIQQVLKVKRENVKPYTRRENCSF